MRTLRVLADANVLYSRTLRDWLILVQLQSETPPYRTYWTEDILAEVLDRQRRAHPEWDGARTARVRDSICGSLEGGRIEDFTVDGSFPGDRDDQHVHAAAVGGGIDVVLTADGGFAAPGVRAVSPYEVCAPDEFFLGVDVAAPHLVRAAAAAQDRYHRGRGGPVDLAESLRRAGCRGFADRVEQHLRALDPGGPGPGGNDGRGGR